MQERPFLFVVGSQKSGTTWLRNCLRHFVSIEAPEWYYPHLFHVIEQHVARFGGSLTPADRADRAIRMAKAAWFELVGDFGGDKSAYPSAPDDWLNPAMYPFAVRWARKHFPSGRVVVIVRDPRGVYNSLKHYLDVFRPGWSEEISPTSFGANWALNNKKWIADNPDAIVRFEDLKKDFEEQLVRVVSALGYPIQADKIECIKALEYEVSRRRVEQPEIYRTGTSDEWRYQIDKESIAAIEASAREVMDQLGYTCDDPSSP
jgi:hypothetical protein